MARHGPYACVALLVLLAAREISSSDDERPTVEFRAQRTEVIRQDDHFVKRYQGDVVVEMNPEVWLKADEAVYDALRHEVRLRGGITAADSGRILHTDRMTYLLREHPRAGGRPVLFLHGRVFAADTGRTLLAARAEYWPDADSIVAVGTVRVEQRGSSLSADTVIYDARRQIILAMGRVELADSAQDMRIRAWRYRYSRADSEATVSGRPVLIKGHGDTTVVITADSMRLEERTGRAVAWDSVHIRRGMLQARCDSLVYDDRAGRVVLHGAPRATQMTEGDSITTLSEALGEKITLSLDGARVRTIEIEGTARAVATEYDSLGTMIGERWIAGRKIIFHVENDRLTEIEVHGQARSRYVPPPSARDEEGISEVSGDTMRIAFSSDRMRHVHLRGGVRGVFWPPMEEARRDTTNVAGEQTGG